MTLTPADIHALSRLLDEAGGVDLAARPAWLARHPAARGHLQQPLREMLQAAPSRCLPPLPRLDTEIDADGEETARPGDRVGCYRLLREIGQGGMGSVWLAERADGEFERRVALKLPRPAWGGALVRRMRRERRIGALLEHPHIARLYDTGSDANGRPYIAMAYIDGQPIDAWCRQQHAGPRECLLLFLQVLRAVAHAHARGVVHCDIKPGNILVDAAGQAHLLDFGIATLLADTAPGGRMTQELGRVLTPHYASPEQACGEPVGVPSDIYSLGVTLFELLTGQLAQPTLTGHARGDEAPRASQTVHDPAVRRQLRGDLDAILAHALQIDPRRRYTSAEAFAHDIEQHLAGLPVRARPDGGWARCRRFVRRQRQALLLVVTVGTACAAGVLVTLTQARHAADQSERTRIVTRFVAELFSVNAAASMQRPGLGAAGPGRLLDAAAQLIESRFGDDPALQAELYGAVARVYADIGVGALAVEFARRHLQALERSGAGPEQRAPALLLVARASAERGAYAEAESQARAAVLLSDVRTPLGLEARAVLAGLLLPNGRTEEARALIGAAEAAWPLDRSAPGLALARLIDAKARWLEIDNHFDEALLLWRRAIEMAAGAGPDGASVANRIRLRLASELVVRNRMAEARPQFDAAISALSAAGDAGRVQAALAASRHAALAFWMGNMDHAEALALIDGSRQTIAAWGPALPPHLLANMEVNQGVLALRHGDVQAAAPLLRRAVPVAEAATDGLIDRRKLASYMANLEMLSGHHDAADPWLQRRRQLRAQAGEGRAPFAVYDWVLLSHNALMKGDAAAAAAVLAQAPAFAPLRGDPQAGGAAYARAVTEQQVRIELQRGAAWAALAALPEPYGLEPAEDSADSTLAPYALRGEALCAAGQPADGLPYLEASLRAVAAASSTVAPGLARLRAVAGLCALPLGRRADAQAWARQARAAFARQPGVSGWYRAPLRRLEAALVR